jgi:hypothetical protein
LEVKEEMNYRLVEAVERNGASFAATTDFGSPAEWKS